MVSHVDDTAPYIALMFEGVGKTNGKKRYKKLLKGKASELDENYQSKSDKPNPQTDTINIKFLKRDYDGIWEKKKTADEDHPDYVPSIGAGWYTAVESGADVVVPTVTCVPADSATEVAAASTVALTFNEAMTISSLVVGESLSCKRVTVLRLPVRGLGMPSIRFIPLRRALPLLQALLTMRLLLKRLKTLAGNALAGGQRIYLYHCGLNNLNLRSIYGYPFIF